MTTIHIPESVEALKAGLGGLDRLLTAKQWEKAATVFAWTRGDGRGGKDARNEHFSPTTFPTAILSRPQVTRYRAAWKSAADELGDPTMLDIHPGDSVNLPDLTWKDHFGEPTPEVQERVARTYIAKNPSVVAEAMKAVPAVADAAVKAVVDDHDLAEKHERMSNSKRWTGQTVDKGPHVPVNTQPDFSYDEKVQAAIKVLHQALLDEQRGVWKPGSGMGLLLNLLMLNLNKRNEAVEAARPAVFKDIDDFLKAARS